MEKNKISIWAAIAININVIVGSAFFLGAPEICNKGGMLAPLTWVMWGFIICPIVLVLAKLSKFYTNAGGIYTYAQKELGSFWSFLSGWGYFIGTIAGNAIIIHKFGEGVGFLGLTPILNKLGISGLPFDIILIALFTSLNLLNVNFIEKANLAFALVKIIPLAFVVISSLFLFRTGNVTAAPINFTGFFETIPLVIFAYIGFEVCCSIAHQIKDGKKNASRAILFSFGIIMLIYTIVQLCFLGIHGTVTINPFLEILPKLTSNNILIGIGNRIIEATIMSSFLGGFYGAFYTNNWILYAIAKNKELPFHQKLIKLNKHKVPSMSIFSQSILTIIFLFITQNAYSLISMSDFAIIISYFLSVIAFLAIYLKNQTSQNKFQNISIGIIASFSCFYLLFYCTKELIRSNHILSFLIIITVGILLNQVSNIKRKKLNTPLT